jgi:DNA-binding NarL/FixJ family response regulator
LREPVRIALCDDHAVVRSGLRRILEAEPDLEVIGEAGSVAEAIALAEQSCPDVFVMDIGLPDGSGLKATAEICTISPATRVLVLTVHDDVAYLRRAFEAGAVGYLVKEAADIDLVQAVRQVAAGGQYVHPTLGASRGRAESSPPGKPTYFVSSLSVSPTLRSENGSSSRSAPSKRTARTFNRSSAYTPEPNSFTSPATPDSWTTTDWRTGRLRERPQPGPVVDPDGTPGRAVHHSGMHGHRSATCLHIVAAVRAFPVLRPRAPPAPTGGPNGPEATRGRR